jgi:hypothetical protein
MATQAVPIKPKTYTVKLEQLPQQCNVCGATWDIVLGAIGVANFKDLGDDEEYTPTCAYGTETNPCSSPTDLLDDGGQPICQKHADEARRATRIAFQNSLEANE